MKKLLLTSAGLINEEISDVLLGEISKSLNKARVLIVTYTQTQQEEMYVEESKQELLDLGFKNIIVFNMHRPAEIANLGDFEVIYICGGNTFAILDKLRETRLDEFILKQIENGTIYIGVSAGSIIAGPDIKIAGWGSEGDKNEIGLVDFKGFGLVDIAIFPHFHEELRGEVEEFRKRVSYKVVELTNEQALFVRDDEAKIIN